MKLKYSLSSHPTLVSADAVYTLLSPFGPVEKSEIVVSLKPAPPKKPKRGIALVPFKQIGDAFGAVCASGRAQRGFDDIEVTWAEGKEPELIGWLKKMGKLGSSTQHLTREDSDILMASQSDTSSQAQDTPSKASTGPYSSFPSTFVSAVSLMYLQPPTNEPL